MWKIFWVLKLIFCANSELSVTCTLTLNVCGDTIPLCIIVPTKIFLLNFFFYSEYVFGLQAHSGIIDNLSWPKELFSKIKKYIIP